MTRALRLNATLIGAQTASNLGQQIHKPRLCTKLDSRACHLGVQLKQVAVIPCPVFLRLRSENHTYAPPIISHHEILVQNCSGRCLELECAQEVVPLFERGA